LEARRDIFAQGLAGMMGNFWFFIIVDKPWPLPVLMFPQINPMLMIGLI
jgi:hypothetical protein